MRLSKNGQPQKLERLKYGKKAIRKEENRETWKHKKGKTRKEKNRETWKHKKMEQQEGNTGTRTERGKMGAFFITERTSGLPYN